MTSDADFLFTFTIVNLFDQKNLTLASSMHDVDGANSVFCLNLLPSTESMVSNSTFTIYVDAQDMQLVQLILCCTFALFLPKILEKFKKTDLCSLFFFCFYTSTNYKARIQYSTLFVMGM